MIERGISSEEIAKIFENQEWDVIDEDVKIVDTMVKGKMSLYF